MLPADEWRERLLAAGPGCRSYRDVLVSALGEGGAVPALEMLANLAALVLVDEAEEPLRPVFPGASRSVGTFTEEDLDQLKASAETLPLDLRARVRDLLWIRRRGAEHESARLAVRDYCDVALQLVVSSDPVWDSPRSRLSRALALSRQLNFAEGRDAVRAALLRLVDGCTSAEVRLHAAELLGRCGKDDAHMAAAVALAIAETAVAAISDAPTSWDWHRHAFEVAAACRMWAGDADGAKTLRIRAARLWVQQERWLEARGVPAATRAFVIESAMVAMRDLGVNGPSIDEVHVRLRQVQREMASDTTTFHGPSLKAGSMEALATNAVRGQSFRDAVAALVCLCPIATLAELRAVAEQSIMDAPLAHLFAHRRIDATGRTVAERPGIDLRGTADEAVQAGMSRSPATPKRGLAALVVKPARRVIAAEHPGAIGDWAQLLRDRPLVPRSRLWTVARGLSAGLHGDMIASTAILAPAMEHFARTIVVAAGGVTTDFDAGSRVQEEASLSALLRRPELVAAIGEDLAFDLCVLLDDRFGANLRNNVAHGLLDDSDLMGPDGIYLWFSVLRLVMLVGTTSRADEGAVPA